MKEPSPFGKPGDASRDMEALATLRAVAQRPAAEGLEARVKAGLAEKLLAGPPAAEAEFGTRGWMPNGTMRGLAAAAIVLVVVGGGWGAARYGRRSSTPQAVGIPRMAAPGEFSNSGAMRTPQTLTPPKVPKPKHEARAAERHTGKAKAGKREKPAGSDARKANALKDGAPEQR